MYIGLDEVEHALSDDSNHVYVLYSNSDEEPVNDGYRPRLDSLLRTRDLLQESDGMNKS